ncbi:helix-turn-helix transcriptional regulator [Caldifermentibacillus hisashii]|uniref:helix-turn-helix domain-containing protein n=1 Tax=Caldifermentibacillus hisashii TaxID=996558 RepID=UPI002E01F781|nr:helix-turn-helix transcriptional regulator [Caldibacillus thermoamylovorans]MEC5272411.1 helix-turn-helix transcriptional regulator [Caldifermentibacillus hisashii]
MKRIKTRIKDELDARGMTQKELADLTGIRPATINDLYHDRSKQFPRDVLEKIASALNIDEISEIIELVDDGQAE